MAPQFKSLDPSLFAAGPSESAQRTERKEEAGIRGTVASTERTETLTPLDAEGVFLANQEKRRKLGLPVLTPAQEEADKKFAEKYVEWRNSGGMPTLNRQLDQIQDALNVLRTNDTITGPVIGRLPKFIQQYINPKAPDVRAQVEDVIQRSLRQILGAQFTAVEGERMIARAYDPEQQEQSNIARLNRVIQELRGQGAAKEASSRFFETQGTLKGYTQKEADKVLEEYGAANAPKGGQRWMRDDQEAVLNRYAQGNPTAQGYADLLIQFAQEQGFEPDAAWRQSALDRGREVENFRAKGGEYSSEGIRYLGGVPKPIEGETRREDTGPAAAVIGGPSGGPPSGGATPPGNGLTFGSMMGSAAQRFLPNVAEVGLEAAQGLAQAVTSPVETGRALYDVGSSVLGALGITDADPAQANQIGRYLADRYGGVENVMRTFAEEPAAVLFDASALLTGGGSAAAKGAAMLGRTGRIGRAVETAGRVIDPLSATVGGAEWLADAARRYAPAPVKAATQRAGEFLTQRIPAEIAALPSGVGGETIQQAFGAGREAGKAPGGVTPRSEAFRGQQTGKASAAEIVNSLDAGVQRMRDAASTRYQTDIAPVTSDKTILDLTDAEKRLNALRPPGLGRYKTKRTPSSHAAWLEAKNMLDQHKALMAKDPATYGTPGAIDAFRRELYDTLEGYAEGGDRSASRIAKGMYQAIRQTVQKQAPDYDKTLRTYSEAQELMDQINRSLRSGKNVDASVRKLQSVMKRPDSGYAGELLEQVDDTGTLQAQIAGRAGSSLVPDRLRSSLMTAQTMLGGAAALPSEVLAKLPGAESMTPEYLLGALSMSPRVATSTAYGAGKATGLAERGLESLARRYQEAPALASAGVAGFSEADRLGEELEKARLLREYGLLD